MPALAWRKSNEDQQLSLSPLPAQPRYISPFRSQGCPRWASGVLQEIKEEKVNVFTARRNYSEYELVTKSNFLKYRDFNAVLVDELVNERQ